MAVVETPKVGTAERRGTKLRVVATTAPIRRILPIVKLTVGSFDSEPKVVAVFVLVCPKGGDLGCHPLVLGDFAAAIEVLGVGDIGKVFHE